MTPDPSTPDAVDRDPSAMGRVSGHPAGVAAVTGDPAAGTEPASPVRWALYALGTVVAGWGLYGLLTAPMAPDLGRWLRFAVGVAVLNDGLLMPLGVAVGVLVVRLVPGAGRAYVQAGLLVSGAVTLVALPFVAGLGRTPDVPSALPLSYGRGLLVTLAAVWLGVAAVAAGRAAWARLRARRPRGAAPPP